MINNALFKRFLSSTTDTIIYDLKTNPQKGLKKLSGLINRFAKHSIRDDLLNALKSNSDLIVELANNLDPDTIKSFIFNMVYNPPFE